MSAGIKRMLAERERLEEDAAKGTVLDISTDLLVMIDKAAPFMDEGCPPNKWPPSAKLKIAYCVISTGSLARAEKRAIQFVLLMLDKARKLWIEGTHPDPWADDPVSRAD